MIMTIDEFMYLSLDENGQLVEIWNNETSCTVWKGLYSDIPNEYKELEIDSWNAIAHLGICFNVSIEE